MAQVQAKASALVLTALVDTVFLERGSKVSLDIRPCKEFVPRWPRPEPTRCEDESIFQLHILDGSAVDFSELQAAASGEQAPYPANNW